MLRRKKQGPVRAKKTLVDGISFSSGLEAYMYKALKDANIKAKYEGYTYELMREFEFTADVYERCANGKGEYKNRGYKNIRKISYTPDFIGDGFIIECKGRPNESFPLRWKLFKKFAVNTWGSAVTIYKPQNQKECDETVTLILSNKQH
tara:strand:- start:1387 stop:1833 length:447 start_codon:yes stop_codon:yes gene_type:complete